MSKLSEQISADLKEAMIAGDKKKVSVFRGLKSVIQYAQVARGQDLPLTEAEITTVLQKESKKRLDAYELYLKVGDGVRSAAELYEKDIIDQYLPKLLEDAEINKLIDDAEREEGPIVQKNMGKIIGRVKQSSSGAADGSLIAKLVKARIEG